MSTQPDEEEAKTEHILDKSNAELLIFGCTRSWNLLYFPGVLCHLILHYYGTTFIWTIHDPSKQEYKSKPFMINNITFQTYFVPSTEIRIDNKIHEKENVLQIYTKIKSMPNSIRTCTVFYQYSILSRSFSSRHTFNMGAKRASWPKRFMKAVDAKHYPLHLLITVEPIRIHHWSMDKMIDYQQDVLMKEYVKYKWEIDAKILKGNGRYLQSDTFGICWCMDLDLKTENLYLKLLRLAPNINRIKVESSLKANGCTILNDEEFQFTFLNEGSCLKLNRCKEDSNTLSSMLKKKKKVVFDIEVRIIEVYAINAVDDFETNDKMISINKWTQYGIIS